jgi:alkylation response protein AidB-like acyl-CoA dehydrogenase
MTTNESGANYVLTALLPRLEKAMPGLLEELASGISADKEAIRDSGKMTLALENVFISAENILGRAGA